MIPSINKQLIGLLVCLLFTNFLFGQFRSNLKTALHSKDFTLFEKSIKGMTGMKFYRECFRDLTLESKEVVYIFEQTMPDTMDYTDSRLFSFRLSLITTGKNIIFYNISEIQTFEAENRFITVDSFKNDTAYAHFKASFKRIFDADINENELFITDFVFGEACGIVGIPPVGRLKVNEFVQNKDKESLIKWLQSCNTEKQLYAIDGLFQLKKSGIKLTDKELKMIKFIKNKEGTISYCSGCLYNSQEIKRVGKRYRF